MSESNLYYFEVWLLLRVYYRPKLDGDPPPFYIEVMPGNEGIDTIDIYQKMESGQPQKLIEDSSLGSRGLEYVNTVTRYDNSGRGKYVSIHPSFNLTRGEIIDLDQMEATQDDVFIEDGQEGGAAVGQKTKLERRLQEMKRLGRIDQQTGAETEETEVGESQDSRDILSKLSGDIKDNWQQEITEDGVWIFPKTFFGQPFPSASEATSGKSTQLRKLRQRLAEMKRTGEATSGRSRQYEKLRQRLAQMQRTGVSSDQPTQTIGQNKRLQRKLQEMKRLGQIGGQEEEEAVSDEILTTSTSIVPTDLQDRWAEERDAQGGTWIFPKIFFGQPFPSASEATSGKSTQLGKLRQRLAEMKRTGEATYGQSRQYEKLRQRLAQLQRTGVSADQPTQTIGQNKRLQRRLQEMKRLGQIGGQEEEAVSDQFLTTSTSIVPTDLQDRWAEERDAQGGTWIFPKTFFGQPFPSASGVSSDQSQQIVDQTGAQKDRGWSVTSADQRAMSLGFQRARIISIVDPTPPTASQDLDGQDKGLMESGAGQLQSWYDSFSAKRSQLEGSDQPRETSLIPTDLQDRWAEERDAQGGTWIFPKTFFGQPFPSASEVSDQSQQIVGQRGRLKQRLAEMRRKGIISEETDKMGGIDDKLTGEADLDKSQSFVPSELRDKWTEETEEGGISIFPKDFFGQPFPSASEATTQESSQLGRLRQRLAEMKRIGEATSGESRQFQKLRQRLAQMKETGVIGDQEARDTAYTGEGSYLTDDLAERWTEERGADGTWIYPKTFFGQPFPSAEETTSDQSRQLVGQRGKLMQRLEMKRAGEATYGKSRQLEKLRQRLAQMKETDVIGDEEARDSTQTGEGSYLTGDLAERWTEERGADGTWIYPKTFFGQPFPSPDEAPSGHSREMIGQKGRLKQRLQEMKRLGRISAQQESTNYIPIHLRHHFTQQEGPCGPWIVPSHFLKSRFASDIAPTTVTSQEQTGQEATGLDESQSFVPADLQDRWTEERGADGTWIYPKTFFGQPFPSAEETTSDQSRQLVGQRGKLMQRLEMKRAGEATYGKSRQLEKLRQRLAQMKETDVIGDEEARDSTQTGEGSYLTGDLAERWTEERGADGTWIYPKTFFGQPFPSAEETTSDQSRQLVGQRGKLRQRLAQMKETGVIGDQEARDTAYTGEGSYLTDDLAERWTEERGADGTWIYPKTFFGQPFPSAEETTSDQSSQLVGQRGKLMQRLEMKRAGEATYGKSRQLEKLRQRLAQMKETGVIGDQEGEEEELKEWGIDELTPGKYLTYELEHKWAQESGPCGVWVFPKRLFRTKVSDQTRTTRLGLSGRLGQRLAEMRRLGSIGGQTDTQDSVIDTTQTGPEGQEQEDGDPTLTQQLIDEQQLEQLQEKADDSTLKHISPPRKDSGIWTSDRSTTTMDDRLLAIDQRQSREATGSPTLGRHVSQSQSIQQFLVFFTDGEQRIAIGLLIGAIENQSHFHGQMPSLALNSGKVEAQLMNLFDNEARTISDHVTNSDNIITIFSYGNSNVEVFGGTGLGFEFKVGTILKLTGRLVVYRDFTLQNGPNSGVQDVSVLSGNLHIVFSLDQVIILEEDDSDFSVHDATHHMFYDARLCQRDGKSPPTTQQVTRGAAVQTHLTDLTEGQEDGQDDTGIFSHDETL